MTEEQTTNEAWSEVGKQFQSLGESLAKAFRTAWEDEENRQHQRTQQTAAAGAAHHGHLCAPPSWHTHPAAPCGHSAPAAPCRRHPPPDGPARPCVWPVPKVTPSGRSWVFESGPCVHPRAAART